MKAMGYDTITFPSTITPNQWARGYSIAVFKVTPGPIGALPSKQINGDMRVEMDFSTQLAANVTLLVLS